MDFVVYVRDINYHKHISKARKQGAPKQPQAPCAPSDWTG
jgi:hypothetical protein